MTTTPIQAWKTENIIEHITRQETQDIVKASKTWSVMKAILIAACASLAFRQLNGEPQVMLLVEEYLSFPTNTQYLVLDGQTVPVPAFTICPKPSLKASSTRTDIFPFKNFSAASLSLIDFVNRMPCASKRVDLTNGFTTIDRETITRFPNYNCYWNERTHHEVDLNRVNSGYVKCFTLFLDKEISIGSGNCVGQSFIFNFKAITESFENPMIEVLVHDQNEKFTILDVFKPEEVVVFNNTVTEIVIRPEVFQKQDRKEYPCTLAEEYSYSRCMENCFWERVQSRSDIPCLIPSLMPNEANLTKPKCQDSTIEGRVLSLLYRNKLGDVPMLSSTCNCVKRCKTTDYHISVNPTSTCERFANVRKEIGLVHLFFTFPSNRVPHIIETPRVTLLGLLSNIGGIVGICLGVSLITIFDIIQEVYSSIRYKLFRKETRADLS